MGLGAEQSQDWPRLYSCTHPFTLPPCTSAAPTHLGWQPCGGNKEAGAGGGRKGQDGGFICGKILLLGEYRRTDRQMGAQDTRQEGERLGSGLF